LFSLFYFFWMKLQVLKTLQKLHAKSPIQLLQKSRQKIKTDVALDLFYHTTSICPTTFNVLKNRALNHPPTTGVLGGGGGLGGEGGGRKKPRLRGGQEQKNSQDFRGFLQLPPLLARRHLKLQFQMGTESGERRMLVAL
jgi:hypothetical protein